MFDGFSVTQPSQWLDAHWKTTLMCPFPWRHSHFLGVKNSALKKWMSKLLIQEFDT